MILLSSMRRLTLPRACGGGGRSSSEDAQVQTAAVPRPYCMLPRMLDNQQSVLSALYGSAKSLTTGLSEPQLPPLRNHVLRPLVPSSPR